MSAHLITNRDELFTWQKRLEDRIREAVQEFERETGMVVTSVKRFPGGWHNGRPMTRDIEVTASLR